MFYLLKTEPGTYSFADLRRDKQTTWDGVTNPAAVKNLREMKRGDQLIVYHSGDEKSAVGTATVVSVNAEDPKKPLVTVKASKLLAHPKPLATIKADRRFQTSPLLRQSRLSVVPLTEAQFQFLLG